MVTPATSNAMPNVAKPQRPRAMANITRNRKPITSAGPRSFSRKKNTSAIATAHMTGRA